MITGTYNGCYVSNTAPSKISLDITPTRKIDTDCVQGYEKPEVAEQRAFLTSLSKEFNSLDTDNNGGLSSDEISYAKPVQETIKFGAPAGMDIGEEEDSTNDYSALLKNIVNKLMSKFDKNGDGIVTQEEIEESMAENGQKTTSVEDVGTEAAQNSDTEETVTNLASVFMQKLLSHYQNGEKGETSTINSVA